MPLVTVLSLEHRDRLRAGLQLIRALFVDGKAAGKVGEAPERLFRRSPEHFGLDRSVQQRLEAHRIQRHT